jgi:hypothetical protein
MVTSHHEERAGTSDRDSAQVEEILG